MRQHTSAATAWVSSTTRRACAAAAEPGGPTPLSLARELAAAGRAAEGTAAFLVLEAAKPWSRKTHKYFPEPARARAVELWPWGFRFSRRFPREEQAMFDVWMTGVMGHAVTREYGRLGPSPIDNPEFLSLLRAAIAAHREGDRDGAERGAAAIAVVVADASAALRQL